ncbi:MAG: zf-HC2 domain-containing protein [Verrucomicrobiia bacterium]|jgi:predicted anti-sigma-YlaC factor YlaD
MDRKDMSCQTVRDQFDQRLDGRLSGAKQAAFEAHLAACSSCRREWEAYANAWQVLARDEGIEPSFGFAERTVRRLNEPRVDARPWWWRPSIRWATLATAVVAMAVTGWVGHERILDRKHAELYAHVQEGDYLEDYDVIANLDQLKEGHHE